MDFRRPRLSFWQIINMNVGFFGIQYSFGLQQTAINPLYTFLHAKPEELPFLNLAGPLTGTAEAILFNWRYFLQSLSVRLSV
jgi:maltose/moltooligosaccharide transporter